MNTITHWGIRGQKWGIRRYQNLDGTLTELGRQRYGAGSEREVKGVAKYQKRRNKIFKSKKPTIRQLSKLTKDDRHAVLLKSEDLSVLSKYMDELSTSEINERIARITVKQRLSDMRQKQINDIANKVSTVAKAASWVGKNVYEPYKKLQKEIEDENKKAREEKEKADEKARKEYDEAKKEKDRLDREMENRRRNSQIQARLGKLLNRYGISDISEVDALSPSQRDSLLKELDSESKLTKYIYGGMFY